MLHAAVRSVGGAPGSDASSSHPHTPQVVENTIAGDLMVAQVRSRRRVDAVRMKVNDGCLRGWRLALINIQSNLCKAAAVALAHIILGPCNRQARHASGHAVKAQTLCRAATPATPN